MIGGQGRPQSIHIQPFTGEPEKALYYTGVEYDRRGYVHSATLRLIGHSSLMIGVDYQRAYTTRELTGLAIIGLGHMYADTLPSFRRTEIYSGEDHPSYSAYAPLGIEAGGRGHGRRYQAHAMGMAFRSGVFLSDPLAEFKEDYVLAPMDYYSGELRTQFFAYAPMLAEGMNNAEIADIFNCKTASIDKDLWQLNRAMDTDRAELVMIAGGLGVLDPPKITF